MLMRSIARVVFVAAIIALNLIGRGFGWVHQPIRRCRSTSSGKLNVAVREPVYVGSEEVSYGPDSFGDIMGDAETNTFVLGDFSPMERVVLTANGNLQRILSAYYGAPISVIIKKCEATAAMQPMELPSAAAGDVSCFDREVDLVMGGQVVCNAVGKIQLHGEDCLDAVREGQVGVGQLFRYLGVLPKFCLLQAGRGCPPLKQMSEIDVADPPLQQEQSVDAIEKASADTQDVMCLWREYELSCPQLTCTFLETFPLDFLDFKP